MLIPGGTFEHHLMKPGASGPGSYVINGYQLPGGALSEVAAHLKTSDGAAAAKIKVPLTAGVSNDDDDGLEL